MHPDFIVRHNFKKETINDLIAKIFYHVFYIPLKYNFPVICFMGGRSGHGKSMAVAKIFEIISKQVGRDPLKDFRAVNVFHPLEYLPKFDRLLYDKELKQVRFFCLHECRTIMPAKLWYSFVNQNISDMNALTRGIKPLCSFFISQRLADINKDVRSTLTLYLTVRRPKGDNQKVRLRISTIYDDERDIENLRMRKRLLKGYVIDENGKRRIFAPKHFEMTMPNPEIARILKEEDTAKKREIVRDKLEKTHKAIAEEMSEITKTDQLIDYYKERIDQLIPFTRYRKDKFMVNDDFSKMHDLNNKEKKEFIEAMNDKLKVMMDGTDRGARKTKL